MTITGRLPVRARAETKMRSRFGVCLGAMQAENSEKQSISATHPTW